MSHLGKILTLILIMLNLRLTAEGQEREVLGIKASDIPLDETTNLVKEFGSVVLKVIHFMILFFLVVTVIYGVRTLSRKHQNLKNQRNEKVLKERYQDFLAEILSGDYSDPMLALLDGQRENNLALTKADLNKKFNRRILLNEIRELAKYVKGESREKVREIFLVLGFQEECLKKLKSRDWKERLEGIQVFALMDIREAYQPMFSLIWDKHPEVAASAMFAKVHLDTDPLDFLKEIPSLSLWEQMNIHRAMKEMHPSELPAFKKFLTYHQKDVICFACRMAAEFKQVECIPTLIKLLDYLDLEVQSEAVKAIGRFIGEENEEALAVRFPCVDPDFKAELLHALKNIASPVSEDFLKAQLQSGSRDWTILAAEGMIQTGEAGRVFLEQQLETADEQKARWIKHALDERVKTQLA